MTARTLFRATLIPPSLESLAGSTRSAATAADDALRTLASLHPETVLGAEDADFEPLTHGLSDVIERLSPDRTVRRRSEQEAPTCAWLEKRLETGLASAAAFRALLGGLNARVDPAGGWRTGRMGIAADAVGNRIQFPPRTEATAQLERIREMILDSQPALFRAMTVLALLVNAHPFVDGNGRTARILFNAILRRAGMSATTYIPFSELASRARGGFEIRLRQAEIHGKWEPLIDWAATLLSVHRTLAEREDRRSR